MPKRLSHIPDLTSYSNYAQYRATTGSDIPISYASYHRYRRDQIRRKINPSIPPSNKAPDQNAHDIIDRDIKALQQNARYGKITQESRKCDQKELLPEEERRRIATMALKSIEHHIPSNWQCAMTALERLVPQHFAKKEGSSALVGAIGIKLILGKKDSPVQEEIVVSHIHKSNL